MLGITKTIAHDSETGGNRASCVQVLWSKNALSRPRDLCFVYLISICRETLFLNHTTATSMATKRSIPHEGELFNSSERLSSPWKRPRYSFPQTPAASGSRLLCLIVETSGEQQQQPREVSGDASDAVHPLPTSSFRFALQPLQQETQRAAPPNSPRCHQLQATHSFTLSIRAERHLRETR